jgi:hypothetical protein
MLGTQISSLDGQVAPDTITGVDIAVRELSESQWAEALRATLISRLGDKDEATRHSVGFLCVIPFNISNLSEEAINVFMRLLDDNDETMRKVALELLSKTCEEEVDRKLLSYSFDGNWVFLDVQNEIDNEWVGFAAEQLTMPIEEVRRRYEALAERFPLKLAWRRSP